MKEAQLRKETDKLLEHELVLAFVAFVIIFLFLKVRGDI